MSAIKPESPDFSVHISLKISVDLKDRLDKLAQEQGRTRGNLVRFLLEQALHAVQAELTKGKK